jgi:hypothetical protein
MTAVTARCAKGAASASVEPKAPRRAKAAAGRSKATASGDLVKDQVAKLEGMMAALLDKANRGDLPAVDRILKILDRLDRYRGLSQPTSLPGEEDDARERILKKLSDIDLRRATAREAVRAGELPGDIRFDA